MPFLARVRTLSLLIALASSLVVSGQPANLQFRHLGTEAGLSSGFVQALVQDARGFVWIGTQQGLDRYDGVRLHPFGEPALPSNFIVDLGVAPDGSVWTSTSAGLVWFDGYTFSAGLPGASPGFPVRDFASVGSALWVGTETGIAQVTKQGLQRGRLSGVASQDSIRALVRSADGTSLFAATDRGVARFDVTTGRYAFNRTLPAIEVLETDEQSLWAITETGQLLQLDLETLRPMESARQLDATVSVLAASTAYPGWMWVGTRGLGIRLLDTRQGRLVDVSLTGEALMLPRADVTALFERGHTLWVGTVEGVYTADISPPRFLSRSDEGYAPSVMSIHASRQDPDVVWLGTVRSGLHRYRLSTGRAETWFDAPDHPLSVTFAIHEDEDGTLWLGGESPSLWRFRPDSATLETFDLIQDPEALVNGLTPSRRNAGQLWVRTQKAGLWLVDVTGPIPTPVQSWPQLGTVWDVHEPSDEPQTAYVATNSGLLRLDLGTGQAEAVSAACDLSGWVASVTVSNEGTLWVGGFDAWLARVDRRTGACVRYTVEDGLPPGGVGGLWADANGHIWVSAYQGLARFDPDSEVVTRFSSADGVPGSTFHFGAGEWQADGRLLLGSDQGFVSFRPDQIPVDTSLPPVQLTRLLVDGEPVEIPADALVLKHHENDVAVEYASLDLRQPEKTRYRVRLVGAEDEWKPEDAEVRYPLLPPGRYTLQVAASNRDGYWSVPTELAIRITPPYWQTGWFWALVALAIGMVGWVAHRYRIEQLMRVERTRRRIADDLHDDIGSKIAGVVMRLDAARRVDGLPDDFRDRLGRIGEATRTVVGDLRDTVWLVDAERDDLRSVADRMEQFATPMLVGSGAVSRSSIPPVPLTMEARRDLYFLFTEALHNAVRHAGAETVTVQIGLEEGAFVLTVADDGRGFDLDSKRTGHGLGTMQRRADALGADLDIASVPGEGTRIHLRLPLGRYRHHADA